MSHLIQDINHSPHNTKYSVTILEEKDPDHLDYLETNPHYTAFGTLGVDYDLSLQHAKIQYQKKIDEQVQSTEPVEYDYYINFPPPSHAENKIITPLDLASNGKFNHASLNGKVLPKLNEENVRDSFNREKTAAMLNNKKKLKAKNRFKHKCSCLCQII
ncbi:hypothetical protein SteCoe_11485 [Stentor coeruleus]|uniref:Uncharacterized protein n=1 Tax=Stentor coeruleus TaxID=5963 RepID=A0A1R2CD85_9CILI|nr:hypothetical protein SteCoe_11485 [Stentor coeruleus]